MSAEWRPIPGWPGYEASADGRVRSWKSRGTAARQGLLRGAPIVLRPWRQRNGHLYVELCVGGRGASRLVRRLVLAAFCGPCPPGHQAAHLNALRADNRVGNLAWLTPAEAAALRRGRAAA